MWNTTRLYVFRTLVSLQTKLPITFSIARKPSVDKALALLDDERHVSPRQRHVHGLDSRMHDRRAVLGTRLKT